MSGDSELYVPIGQFYTAHLDANSWYRGVPDMPDTTFGYSVVAGVATARNLIAMSPPTLLEEYDLYAFSISWGAVLAGDGTANAPVATVELALLVNDRVVYSQTQDTDMADVYGTHTYWVDTGVFSADLVNPIRVGARERLSLRVGINSSEMTNGGGWILVGAQLAVPTGSPFPPNAAATESVIRYRIIDLPGSRRL